MTESSRLPQLSVVLVNVLKGVLYREQAPLVWDDCLRLQAEVMDYMKKIGLELHVNEAEGFAYLKQLPMENEDGEDSLPRLIQRRPLSYAVSLLCVLLRKKLVESDTTGGQFRLVMTRDQIVDMMRLFLADGSNEVVTEQNIDGCINRVTDFGFLRPLKSSEPLAYEVRRIIKALVDADWLANFDEKLKGYQDHANGSV